MATKKIDSRFQDISQPAKLKGKCPVCSSTLENKDVEGTRFFFCHDHYKFNAVKFEEIWQDFLRQKINADELLVKLLDGNQAENLTPMKLLKANLHGPKQK